MAGSTSFQDNFWEGRECSVILLVCIGWTSLCYNNPTSPGCTKLGCAASGWRGILQVAFTPVLEQPWVCQCCSGLQRRPRAWFVTTGDIHGASTSVHLNRINCSVLPSSNLSNDGLSCNFSLRSWVWCSKGGALHHEDVRSHFMAVHGYLPTATGWILVWGSESLCPWPWNHRITELESSVLEGTHKDHQSPSPGPAEDSPRSPTMCLTRWITNHLLRHLLSPWMQDQLKVWELWECRCKNNLKSMDDTSQEHQFLQWLL